RTLLDEAVEVRRRHELRARTRIHVDELGEEELDPARLDILPDLIQLGHASPSSYGTGGLYHLFRADAIPPSTPAGSTSLLTPSRQEHEEEKSGDRSRALRQSEGQGGKDRRGAQAHRRRRNPVRLLPVPVRDRPDHGQGRPGTALGEDRPGR